MKRVTGIGGIFFKAKDAPSLQAWYKRHLGIDVQVWGGASFDWTDAEGKPVAGTTAWLIDPEESDHFAPSSAPFMVNYRVVPQEFCGVWKINAATNDGVNQLLAEDPDGSLSAGECTMLEIIICETRAIIVQTDGNAMVGRVRVIATQPELKIEWTGFGYHAKQDGPGYAFLKRIDEGTLQFAICERDSQRVDSSSGGCQLVLTATK